mgnify:CR=1 FL=1
MYFSFLKSFKLNIVNVTAINASPDGQFVVLATSNPVANEKNKAEIAIIVYSIDKTIIKPKIERNQGDFTIPNHRYFYQYSEEKDTVNEPKLLQVFNMTDTSKILLNNIYL